MCEQSDFSKSRLLVLGNAISSCEIISIAKSLGAYTIATDYLEDSEFKKIADKSYMISTADIDQLEQMARAEGVTGILAGASEFNIDKAITLSDRLGIPFYATREQWDTLSDKEKFKNLCRQFDVPIVDEYDISEGLDQNIKFPVIVKPVDSSAGIGISVCRNKKEFEEGYAAALEHSKSKRVVVERYMTGDEVVIYYTLQDGYISLSSMCDRYTLKQEGVAPLPTAYVYPSKYLETFQKYDDANIRRMFEHLGMKNGFLFIQAFVEDGRIRVYEMGYRIAGAQGHKTISAVNGINPLEMLVRFSLGGGMSGWDLKTADNPNFNCYACKLTPILKAGTISRIEGYKEIQEIQGVTDIVPIHETGDVISDVGTLKQLLSRIYFKADSLDELIGMIDLIQSLLKVYDTSGQNMLMPGFDTDLLK